MKTPEIIEFPTLGGDAPTPPEAGMVPSDGCFECLFEQTPTGMLVTDGEGRLLRVNQAFCNQLGYSPGEILSQGIRISHPEDESVDAMIRGRLSESGIGALAVEKRFLRRDGSVMRGLVHVVGRRDAQRRIQRLIFQVVDMSDLYDARERATLLAHSDPLTGLANRGQLIREIVDRTDGTRGSRQRFTLLFLSLDRFKVINDILGHAVGDQLLLECGRRISKYLPASSVIGRLGGDEFGVILDDTTADDAVAAASDLTGALQRVFDIDHHHLRVRASIGIACYPSDAENASDLVRRADLAMVRCKASSESCRIYTPELDAIPGDWNVFSEMGLEERNRKLRFALQPVFDVESRAVAFSEVLARIPWEEGLLSPQWIIPMAEASGTIGRFDSAVINRVLDCVRDGLIGPPISINVSALSLSDVSFAPRLIGSIAKRGLDSAQIIIEVTETAALPDIANARQNAVEMRAEGVRIALDDWGSGNTSFAAMRAVPFDILKIDAALVSGIGHNTHDEMLIRHIIAMGRETGFDAVAEGVETGKQLQWLRDQNCGYAQGYYLARPRLVAQPDDD